MPLARVVMVMPLVVLALAGCDDIDAQPIQWWHNLQGGAIAQQRPPPPGGADPWPNLGPIPAKPAALPAGARDQVAQSLAVDQATAQAIAVDAPLAPAPTAPTPGAPPPSGAASASLSAVQAPPAPTKPTQQQQAATVSGGGLPTPPPGAAPGAAKPAGAPSGGAATGPMPIIPVAPPPPPSGLGVRAVTTPVPTPAPLGLVPPEQLGKSANINFPVGADTMPSGSAGLLRPLVSNRHGHAIQVVGRGDAASFEPAAQAAGVALGLRRAQAVAEALQQAGVPGAALQISAQPFGREVTATLLN
jgi:outer membrane protein OmpA-like peptidoglycan-associated protein